jgi:hypothetical protein
LGFLRLWRNKSIDPGFIASEPADNKPDSEGQTEGKDTDYQRGDCG